MKFPKIGSGGGSKAVWTFSKKTSKFGDTGTPLSMLHLYARYIYNIDINDGTFFMTLRCRWFFSCNDAMSIILDIPYHRHQCDCVCSTIDTNGFSYFEDRWLAIVLGGEL